MRQISGRICIQMNCGVFIFQNELKTLNVIITVKKWKKT